MASGGHSGMSRTSLVASAPPSLRRRAANGPLAVPSSAPARGTGAACMAAKPMQGVHLKQSGARLMPPSARERRTSREDPEDLHPLREVEERCLRQARDLPAQAARAVLLPRPCPPALGWQG